MKTPRSRVNYAYVQVEDRKEKDTTIHSKNLTNPTDERKDEDTAMQRKFLQSL